MYFPYLFGKQSEFLALRAAAPVISKDKKVIPIVEPVQKASSNLIRFMQGMQKVNIPAVVIVNPTQGDFTHGIASDWLNAVEIGLTENPNLMPGFCCHSSTSMPQVDAFLKNYSGRPVCLLYQSPHLTDTEFSLLARRAQVAFHICLQGKIPASKRKLLPMHKLVDVTDNFNKQPRNGDYEDPEFFSDRHLNYATDSIGFGDFTVIGSQFQVGGGQPAAVVIHATYKDPASRTVWVEHFVSDDTKLGVGRVEQKYLQAVAKLCNEVTTRPLEFGADLALLAFQGDHTSAHFPGLGKNKEHQIHHHVEMMNSILCGRL